MNEVLRLRQLLGVHNWADASKTQDVFPLIRTEWLTTDGRCVITELTRKGRLLSYCKGEEHRSRITVHSSAEAVIKAWT